MNKVGVTGASGFVGRAVVEALLRQGDRPVALVRNPDMRFGAGVEVRRFDALAGEAQPQSVEGLDAVIHLAGESIAGRWSAAKRRAICDTRILGTRNLVASIAACSVRPRVLIAASAVGYYGSRGDEPLDEGAAPGSDFLANLCVAWERAALAAEGLGLRVACLRQGMVLGPGGGALAAMLPPFEFFIGGPLGGGRQWWPWILLDDDVALFLFALNDDAARGAINAVAPDYATNARLSQALGHALRRPSLVPAPAFALKVAFGEFAQSLLASQLVLNARSEDLGFVFKHRSLERALLDAVAPGSGREPATFYIERSQFVRAPLERTFGFFSDPANLARITPPAMNFQMVQAPPGGIRRGAVLEYRLRVGKLPLRWKSLISTWRPPTRFVDFQLRGPYLLWRHQHDFEPQNGGTLVRDSVEYALPLAPLGNLALPLVRRNLDEIFRFRSQRLGEILEGSAGGV